MTELGRRGGKSIQRHGHHMIRSVKDDDLVGNSKGGSKCQFVPDTKVIGMGNGKYMGGAQIHLNGL
jgi:hypothetical protein